MTAEKAKVFLGDKEIKGTANYVFSTGNFPEFEKQYGYKIGDIVNINGLPDMENGYYQYTENGFVFIGKERRR